MLVIAASYRDYELIIWSEVHTTHTKLVTTERCCYCQRADTPHLSWVIITCHVSHVSHLDPWPVSHLPSHQVAPVTRQGEAGDGLPDTKYHKKIIFSSTLPVIVDQVTLGA